MSSAVCVDTLSFVAWLTKFAILSRNETLSWYNPSIRTLKPDLLCPQSKGIWAGSPDPQVVVKIDWNTVRHKHE